MQRSNGISRLWQNIHAGHISSSDAPFYYHGLISIPAWISNQIRYKTWDEITGIKDNLFSKQKKKRGGGGGGGGGQGKLGCLLWVLWTRFDSGHSHGNQQLIAYELTLDTAYFAFSG